MDIKLPDLFSYDAEQSVLGSLLKDQSLRFDLPSDLSASDFSSENGRIFSVIDDLVGQSKAVDVITVAELMPEKFEYLTDLALNSCRSSNIFAYGEIVKARSRDRAFKNTALKVMDLADQKKPVDEKIQEASSLLTSVERSRDEDGEHVNTVLKNVVDTIDSRFRGMAPKGLMTGFVDLDKKIGGLQPGDFFVVGARPSMGKTVFGMNVVRNAILNDLNCLVFSVEMTKEKLMQRMIADVGNIPYEKIKTAQFNEDDWASLELAVRKIKDANLFLSDISGLPISRAEAIAKKHNREKSIDLIMVDYLQLMTSSKDNSTESITVISQGLKRIAKDTNSVLIALAQLNRSLESRPNKRPLLSDLRQSGSIEQDADIITFLYRDDYYNEDSLHKGIAEFITAKQRDGETGTTYAVHQFNYSRFANLAPDYAIPENTPTEKKYKGKSFAETYGKGKKK
ncbi:replicative DNA helicase [Agarilytica rhodophyticola]|uniref:replicative DNA helicase n=1 Tax=Agarilytica rhodophyticola TaxID=1737490 RepID=UPI000B344C3E|nr:replicative DNA helicase [Agarilytica rhodophyticola]